MKLDEIMTRFIPLERDSNVTAVLPPWLSKSYPKLSLDASGLVALADLTTVARRTALTGTSSLLDTLVLCPGLLKQQNAPELNGGEYPACAAMTTGYVFRVENPATVLYLQKVGRPGKLTTLCVTGVEDGSSGWWKMLRLFYDTDGATTISSAAYSTAVLLSIAVLALLILLRDWWALAVVSILIAARLVNVVIIRRRATVGWKGAPEPGVQGDLLMLLSQDRWVRMRGSVDDLKIVTSGQWLREPSFTESAFVAFSTLMVYLDAALAGNASQGGKLLLLILLFCSAGLLGLANEYTNVLKMHGKVIEIDGARKSYDRRLSLTRQLIKETGRDDWAVRMGMLNSKKSDSLTERDDGPRVM